MAMTERKSQSEEQKGEEGVGHEADGRSVQLVADSNRGRCVAEGSLGPGYRAVLRADLKEDHQVKELKMELDDSVYRVHYLQGEEMEIPGV